MRAQRCSSFLLQLLSAAVVNCLVDSGEQQQFPLLQHGSIKHVAIIGAGAAGTSTAYHLRQYADEYGIPLHITLYERNPYIGGRSTVVNAYNHSAYPVELGASIFVSVNHILQSAVAEFNLSTAERVTYNTDGEEDDPDTLLGIWDGGNFVLTHPTSNPNNALEGWWRQLRLLLRYGTAPLSTRKVVKDVVDRFLKLYEWPHFPFADITHAVRDLTLSPIASITGWEYLKNNGLNGRFAWEIHQAATRVNYASDLIDIHGVETMVSMATDGAVSVSGGNWQIFAAMAKASGAAISLDDAVRSVEAFGQGYKILTRSPVDWDIEAMTYDAVVLAAPFHQMGINWDEAEIQHVPKDDEYRALHTTLFATALPLSRAYFNISALHPLPTTILTTEPQCASPASNAESCDDPRPEFFSISTLRSVYNPYTARRELLYKIFSARPVSNEFLAQLLGLELQTNGEISEGDVSWIYRKKWLSYPIEYPRSMFEPLRLDGRNQSGNGIWYTAGMEGFISTMETSALSGKNVARLMVDEWVREVSTLH